LTFALMDAPQPPELARAIAGLIEKGVEVYADGEDLSDRGLDDVPLVEGVKRLPRSGLVDFLARYDRVWHW
jgi:predicted peroxiredoxin